jgi:hypothetical protein
MTSSSARHLSSTNFAEYVAAGVPLEYPVKGEPRLVFVIDPRRSAIGLRLPRRQDQPIPVTGLEHLQVRAVQAGGERCLEILVTDSRLFIDAYPVLLAIADRIQLDGLSLETALHETLRILGRLLLPKDTLGGEQEVGLFGELLLLRGLLRGLGPNEAVSAWRGPDAAEHDFGVRGLDIEVKTTTAERRIHWIGSLTQLVPSPGHPLWMVSYQVTKAGTQDGMTLPTLIEAIRTGLDSPSAREEFETQITLAGWHNRYTHTTRTRWIERTKAAAYEVVDEFPRLTASLLTSGGVDLGHIPEVKYRIDLSDRPSDEPPVFLGAALDHGETG